MYNKPTLLLISDLLGDQNAEYLLKYEMLLKSHFSIEKIDSCTLGKIVNTGKVEENHAAFVKEEGLRRAVSNLQNKYKDILGIIAFSIGGVIAWRACLEKLDSKYLFCISSTRLRYEVQKPNCYSKLYFGKQDAYKPDSKWSLINQIEIEITDGEHEIYKDERFIKILCQEAIAKIK